MEEEARSKRKENEEKEEKDSLLRRLSQRVW